MRVSSGVIAQFRLSCATRWVVLGVVLSAVNCSSRADNMSVSRRTVGDTTFVASPDGGVLGPMRLVEILRVNSKQLSFGRVDAAAFGPDGSLWVFDAASEVGAAILVLDSLGVQRAMVGREGAGPGEYRAPLRIFKLADGSMLAKEMSTTRAVRFSATGQVLRTLTLPPKVATGWVVTPDTSAGWYITVSFEDNRAERIGRFGWLHFDRNGNVVDTVHPPSHLLTEPTPDGIAPGRIRTVGRDGAVLTTVPGPNRLVRYARDGMVQIMEWPGQPPAYADEERADMQVAEDEMSRLLGSGKRSLPERKQPSNRILTDDQGFIWLQLPTTGVRIPDHELQKGQGLLTIKWRESDRWAAFAADGSLQFIVQLPDSARLLDRSGRALLGMIADSSGEEHLVVWRVEPVAIP